MSVDLGKATRDRDLELLKTITKKQSNKKDDGGMTPVHWASSCGTLESLRILIGRGGDPDLPNNDGSTATHLAGGAGHLPCLVFLTNFGANVHAVDDAGNTPLQEATNRGRVDCMRHLETLMTHQMTQDRVRIDRIKNKSKREAERRVREKAKLMHKLDKEWDRKMRKKKKAAVAVDTQVVKANTKSYGRFKKRPTSVTSVSDTESIIDRKKTFSELIGMRSDSESTEFSSPRSKITSPEDMGMMSSSSYATDPGVYHLNDGKELKQSNGGFNIISHLSGDIVFEKREFESFSEPISFSHTKQNGHADIRNGIIPTGNGKTPREHAKMNGSAGHSRHHRRRTQHSDQAQISLSTLSTFLNALELEEFQDIFQKERIDLRAVCLCDETDLKEIGLPLGPRKKLLNAIRKRNEALSSPAALDETLV